MASVDRSLVAHLPLFAGLNAAELDDLLREARSVRYPKDTNVFEQGSEAHSFFCCFTAMSAQRKTPLTASRSSCAMCRQAKCSVSRRRLVSNITPRPPCSCR